MRLGKKITKTQKLIWPGDINNSVKHCMKLCFVMKPQFEASQTVSHDSFLPKSPGGGFFTFILSLTPYSSHVVWTMWLRSVGGKTKEWGWITPGLDHKWQDVSDVAELNYKLASKYVASCAPCVVSTNQTKKITFAPSFRSFHYKAVSCTWIGSS